MSPLPPRSRVVGRVGRRARALAVTLAGAFGMSCGADKVTAPDPVATKLAIEAALSNVVAGVPISVTIKLTDDAGVMVADAAGSVTVAIASGTGPAGATLNGTLTASASNGSVTFTGLSINKAGTGYQLTVSATGLAGATTSAFTVAPAAPAVLVVSVQPTDVVAGVAIGPAVQIAVQDAFANPVTTATTSVTIAITSGTGASGATLGGTATKAAVAGVASFSDLTLDKAAGGYTLTASATSLTSDTTSALTVTHAVAAKLAFSAQPSNAVSLVSIAPAMTVTVQDAFGNTAASATNSITIAITTGTGAGGAALTGTATVAAVSGVATFNTLKVNKASAGYTLTASATDLTSATSSSFAISAGVAATIAVNAGNNQLAVVDATVATSPSVLVTDASGNPVSGVVVTFAVAANNGSITGATQTTNASGIATISSWKLRTTIGANTLTASAVGVTGTASFTATGTSGAMSQMLSNAGNDQTATVNTNVAVAPSVKTLDSFGNPVAGVPVTWSVVNGGGSATGTSTTTGADGIAAVGSWKLGTNAEATQRLRATIGGTVLDFDATATAGAATTLTLVGAAATDTVLGSSAQPITVRATDAFGNGVPGVSMTFALGDNSTGASLTGGTQTTSSTGQASPTNWTYGTVAGVQTLTATVSGLDMVTVSADVSGGNAVSLAVVDGNLQDGTAGQAVAIRPSVRAKDAYGNFTFTGLVVTFAASGSGQVVDSTPNSFNGLFKIVAWQLDTVAGANTLTASAPGLVSATFTATGLPGTPTKFVAISAESRTDTVKAVLPTTVKLTDQYGNGTPGYQVEFQASTGTLSTSAVLADANGLASTNWTMPTTLGSATLNVSFQLSVTKQFTVTTSAGATASITVAAGDQLVATVGTTTQFSPGVTVKDAYNNVKVGVPVTFAVTGGGGSIAGSATPTLTNEFGQATAGAWTLGTITGANAATATSGGITANFTATGQTGPLAIVSVVSGNNQTGVVSVALPDSIKVKLTDQYGNPIVGRGVQMFDTLSGTVSPAGFQLTNASGIRAARWTPKFVAGARGLRATVQGSVLTTIASATATPDVPAQLVDAGGNRIGIYGQPVSAPPSVKLQDQFGNDVTTGPGVEVTFAITGGDGSIGGATQTTSGGLATLGSWTLGTPGGGLSVVTASATGMADLNFVVWPFNTVSAGQSQTCAPNSGGTSYCWGLNTAGQLLDGTTTNRLTPTLTTTEVWVELSFGKAIETFCRRINSEVRCWGDAGASGLLMGDGVTRSGGTIVSVPVNVVEKTWSTVSVGSDHACAIEGTPFDGLVWCWGVNSSGQLGDGTTTSSASPVATSVNAAGGQVGAGSSFACANSFGTVLCWGANNNGGLGVGPGTASSSTPAAVAGSHSFNTLSVGLSHACALKSNGEAWCWGNKGIGNGADTVVYTPVQVNGGHTFTQIAAGRGTCALDADGHAWCWGPNASGEVGDNSTTDRLEPVQVSGSIVFEKLSVHVGRACGITANKAIYCWGANESGQNGNGTTTMNKVPTLIAMP